MLTLPNRVRLWNGTTDSDAKIVELTPAMARSKIDRQWWTMEGVSQEILSKEPDASWRNWASIASQAQDSQDFACLGCVTPDKAVQGAILYCKTGRSLQVPAEGAVEAMLLATAPRNRTKLANPTRYRGVGSSLLLYAVAHSFLLGFHGRTVLESKPDALTFQFYVNRGFSSLSRTADDKIKMELAPAIAVKWLQSKGINP